MQHIENVIIGGGQAGLATSRCLTDQGRDHVVLERGRLAERWRTERWDSLRLLTPNWMSRLPGHHYTGPDPDGFMSAPELVEYFETYAESFGAPIQPETSVLSVERSDDGYLVQTDHGPYRATNVVIATGHADVPRVPAMAASLPGAIEQLTPTTYRNPADIAEGGVLVVGASASGVQIADELRRAGRAVTIAVGSHRRAPRRYRGADIMRWLDDLGALGRTVDTIADFDPCRHDPSLQLVGRPTGENLDLATLDRIGVRLVGRLTGIDGRSLRFADDLARTTQAADLRLRSLLDRIDEHIAIRGLPNMDCPSEPVEAIPIGQPSLRLDARDAPIHTVIWATGFGRDYRWLHVPVFGACGEIRQRRGVTPSPGLYVVGLAFQHRRDASFIDGVRHDARYVTDHLARRSTGLAAVA